MIFYINNGGPSGIAITSAVFNILAAAFLICALVPAFLDAKKFQKTFFIEENFFKFFFFGASSMWLNAVITLGKTIWGDSRPANEKWDMLAVFTAFIISNTVSAYINHYSWSIKKRNMRESEKMGISEQQYWETVIAPTLENKK